ncbi:MAG: N-formylglutamate amidohydrolase [Pseudomonadota bacterium]
MSFSVHNPDSDSSLLLVCDHASNAIPESYAQLGVDDAVLGEHVALDIGALNVTRTLATRFSCTAIESHYSRLLVDLNRFPDHPTWIPPQSDGIQIPGNQALSESEREHRAREYFWPYQNAVGAAVERISSTGKTPILVSIHSFTPALRGGGARPWHFGVLWNDIDARLSAPLYDELDRMDDVCVGNNEPYHANNPTGFTVKTHSEAYGHPHVLIEIRQDLIDSEAGVAEWSQRFGDALDRVLQTHGYFQPPE